MTKEQLERLLQAIEANTRAQLAVAEHVAGLADECAQLASIAAEGDPEQEDGAPAMDMAGRPIKQD